MIEEVILKQAVKQNDYSATIYKSSVWELHSNAVDQINTRLYKNLLEDNDFINFIKDSDAFLQNNNNEVVIYTQSGQKILTNKNEIISHLGQESNTYYNKFFLHLDKYFLHEYMNHNNLSDALQGKTVHSLLSHILVPDQDNSYEEKSCVISYIPIISSKQKKDLVIEGVIQITTDVTEQWNNMVYLEKRILMIFIIVFLVFFIIITYNENYAQNIVNKQLENNRALEDAKIKAEMENSSKTEFLSNVSHELRTPLNAIIGFSEIIVSETYGKIENKYYQSYIHDINVSGKHLLSVINDILDFSKVSANQLSVDMIAVNLNKIVTASMRFVTPRADAASVKLVHDIPKNHVIIPGDPKRLKQALLNILSNAVKFTPSKGVVTITIKTDTTKKLVYVIVTDTGIGMCDQDIPKALSSFGQIDNRLSRKYEGTGIGLPLTKKIIELMNGKLDLDSKQGAGTVVTLSFKYIENLLS